MEVKIELTHGGFRGLFLDGYGNKCSISESSAIDDTDEGMEHPGSSFLWVGLEELKPMVLHEDARKLGIETDAAVGWVPYPIPKEVLKSCKMHLGKEQVRGLILALQRWLDTGTLAEEPG